MTSFTFPASALPRLGRLVLAADTTPGMLRHIALRVTPTVCRFSATDGKLLAAITHAVTNLQGDPVDVILDREQFTAACKLLGKTCTGSVSVSIDATEVKITAAHVSALIRRREGTFPEFNHIWERTTDQRWIPNASSLHPDLIARAQAIVGKSTILFRSPVPAHSGAALVWIPEGDVQVQRFDIAAWVSAPAYWADHDLAPLLMPITRSDADHQFDLSRFACRLPQPEVALAA